MVGGMTLQFNLGVSFLSLLGEAEGVPGEDRKRFFRSLNNKKNVRLKIERENCIWETMLFFKFMDMFFNYVLGRDIFTKKKSTFLLLLL